MATVDPPQTSPSPEDEKHVSEKVNDTMVSNMFANAASATGWSSYLSPLEYSAKVKIDKEHNMSLWEGIKLYPKAIFWAAVISACCAMEGYDIALIGNFYAFPPFNRKYGELQPDGSYQVPAQWQAGLSNGAQCGQIIGLLRALYSVYLVLPHLLTII